MTTGFAARLVAYEPGGERVADAMLDGVSWDASLPLNDVAALTLSYPAIVDAVGLMEGPVEIGLEVSDGGAWVEPRNGRFLSSEFSANAAQDLDVPSFTFRGLGALLERPFILRQQENAGKPYTSDENDPKRNFLSATPGQIIHAVVNESRAKYPTMLDGITLGFTAGQDSLGAGWNVLESSAYSAGTDLLRLMDDLVARGLIDWWMDGRTLKVVNADSASVHHSQQLLLGDATEAPIRVTYEGMATHIALEGGQGLYREKQVPGANVPYGAKPIRIANDSVTTVGTAVQMVDAQIASSSQPRREYTRSIADLTRGPLPLIDWLVGDWVQAENWQGAYEEVRAFEVGISYDAKDTMPSARVTLNDRFIDAQVRQAKRLSGITHGTTQNLGDGGIPSSVDKAVPAAPLGVVANSLGYWADNVPLSSVDVAWQPVTTSVDGLPLNGVDAYEVAVGGQSKRVESGTTAAFDGLQPSRIYEVRVRAVSSTGIAGRWSSFLEVLTAYPLEQLPPPTAPILRSENGALQTEWDGLLQYPAGPDKPPLHFSHVLVETQKVGTSSWTRWGRDQGTVLVGLTVGDKWRVRLVAVDMLDRESEPGLPTETTIKSAAQQALDDLLATQEAVEALQTTATGANARLFMDWGAERPTTRRNGSPLQQGDELVTRKDGAAVRVEVWNGTAWGNSYALSGQIFVLSDSGTISLANGVVDTPALKAGAVDAFQITSPLIQSVSTANRGIKWVGSQFIGYTSTGSEAFRLDATRATITGGTFQTSATGNRGIKITSTGLRAFDANGNETVTITQAGNVSLVGNIRSNIGGTREVRLGEINSTEGAGLRLYNQQGARIADFRSGNSAANDWGINFYDDNGSSTIGRRRLFLGSKPGSATGVYLRMWDKDGVERILVDDEATMGFWVRNPASGYYARITGNHIVSTGVWENTTTASANLCISSSGHFFRSTSMSSAKLDIREISDEVNQRILNLRVVDWVDRGETERTANTRELTQLHAEGALSDEAFERMSRNMDTPRQTRRIPGVTVEDVIEAGLGEFVDVDAEGEPSGVMYDRLALTLIPLVKRMRQEIDTLKEQINAQ